jgi:hypothetical protein
MTCHGFQPREVVVPKPLLEYTTTRLLVMELLEGPKLIDGIREYFSEYAKRNGTTLHALEEEARETIEREGIPEKYDGPSAFQMGLYRRYLGLRDMVANLGIASYNSTVGALTSKNPPISYQQSMLPPNIPRIIDILMRVHGYQLLADGVFNSGRSCCLQCGDPIKAMFYFVCFFPKLFCSPFFFQTPTAEISSS